MDWGDPADALKTVDLAYTFVFTFYIALTCVAMLNVVTGIFVESATKTALHDRNTVIQDQMNAQNSYVEDVREIFSEADIDGSGTVTWSEFEGILEDERVVAFLNTMEIDPSEARGLFHLLDS